MNDCIINAPIKIVDSIIADGTEIKKNESEESVYLLGERSKITL
jgi:NDP-sugar pyrophosphorylase family protein